MLLNRGVGKDSFLGEGGTFHGMWDLSSLTRDQTPHSLRWQHGVSTTGPPGKSVEKTLESPLDCKEIQPVYSEGDQPWDFFGGNDAEAETPVLWPPDAKS